MESTDAHHRTTMSTPSMTTPHHSQHPPPTSHPLLGGLSSPLPAPSLETPLVELSLEDTTPQAPPLDEPPPEQPQRFLDLNLLHLVCVSPLAPIIFPCIGDTMAVRAWDTKPL